MGGTQGLGFYFNFTTWKNVLTGMNSVIMDDVEIGDECIVGALSFINANTKIPASSLVVGNPARIIKEVSDEMIAWKTKGTRLYQMLPKDCYDSLKPVEALTEMPEDRPMQESLYETWNKINPQTP